MLAWAGWERTLDIRGVGVSIQDASGQELASVPEVGFGLSGAALFRGLVAPSRIELFRPELALGRNEDGDFQFGTKLISGAEPASERAEVLRRGRPRWCESCWKRRIPASAPAI